MLFPFTTGTENSIPSFSAALCVCDALTAQMSHLFRNLLSTPEKHHGDSDDEQKYKQQDGDRGDNPGLLNNIVRLLALMMALVESAAARVGARRRRQMIRIHC